MIDVARQFARGSLGLAGLRLRAQRVHGRMAPRRRSGAAHVDRAGQGLGLGGRTTRPWWRAGRPSVIWRPARSVAGCRSFYRARGFAFPGAPGSAPPLLAQHDWVHVLADFGTTVECELEVFAFIARANDDMRGFSLLAMVVSLFETGYLRTGAGLFESDLGHLSAGAGHGGSRGRRHAPRRALPATSRPADQHRLPAPRLVRAGAAATSTRSGPGSASGPSRPRPSPPDRSGRGSPAASAPSSSRPDRRWPSASSASTTRTERRSSDESRRRSRAALGGRPQISARARPRAGRHLVDDLVGGGDDAVSPQAGPTPSGQVGRPVAGGAHRVGASGVVALGAEPGAGP